MILPVSVFISRELGDASVFRGVLEGYGVRVYGQSLVVLTQVALPEGLVVGAEWVFFYSGNGVRFFLEQVGRVSLPKGLRWAVIGEGTGRVLADCGYQADFVGSGRAADTVAALGGVLSAGERVLFVGARVSEHSVERLLEPSVCAGYWVVYDNVVATSVVRRQEQVLVFTSPLNVQAYCEVYDILGYQQVLAIGHTTSAMLDVYGVGHRVADSPSEGALVEGVLKMVGLGAL